MIQSLSTEILVPQGINHDVVLYNCILLIEDLVFCCSSKYERINIDARS